MNEKTNRILRRIAIALLILITIIYVICAEYIKAIIFALLTYGMIKGTKQVESKTDEAAKPVEVTENKPKKKVWEDVVPAYQLEKWELPKGRKYSYGVVGSQYEKDNGLTGDYIMEMISFLDDGKGKYYVALGIEAYEGETAIKVYAVDGEGTDWHIGWIAKDKIKTCMGLMRDADASCLRITTENGKIKGFVDFIIEEYNDEEY